MIGKIGERWDKTRGKNWRREGEIGGKLGKQGKRKSENAPS